MAEDNQFIEKLIFNQMESGPRFTQDSPVYPDVWLDYYEHRNDKNYRADLILIPHKKSSVAELFTELSEYLLKRTLRDEKAGYQMASNGDSVVVRLTFFEMIAIALPLTNWWQNYLWDENGNPTNHYLWLDQMISEILYYSPKDFSKEIWSYQAYRKWLFVIREKPNRKITLWSINRNRTATLSIESSVPATKADSGRRLFDIDGSGISWAVIDSGIDARHTAFRKINKSTSEPFAVAMGSSAERNPNNTRIAATYDFTKFREVISDAYIKSYTSNKNQADENSNDSSAVRNESQAELSDDRTLSDEEFETYIMEIGRNLKFGRMLDWSVIAPILRIPHNLQDYRPPGNPHGTHVAGILAANQPENGLIGMCPGIQLYDIRVMDSSGISEEFNILAAIQFVRWLNNQKENLSIHGVNMSFSMKHDVASYACGQTPVCVACDRLVAEGTVVVAAAGNLGQTMYQSKEGSLSMGFRMVNITDPGNAQRVITVGATHRNQPHAYGVSYFSSKGPTGDGRIKPDLVAPGEKIMSTMPNDGMDRMDGTSMAAPHVSGAAALILSKHRELIGKPDKIKEILCSTATDLGREKYFQGCGMLDVLRAVQAV